MSPTLQMFDFEPSAVRLEHGIIQPLRDAITRWTNGTRASYWFAGTHFDILYELKGGRFVLLRYECCVMVAGNGGGTVPGIWSSNELPTGREVTKEQALDLLLRWKLEIPASLDSVLPADKRPQAQKDLPPARDLSHWSGKGYTDYPTRSEAPQGVYVIEITGRIRDAAIGLVQFLRQIDPAKPQPKFLDTFFQYELFKQYQVDPKSWWGPPDEIPPRHVRLVDTLWPTGSDRIRQSVRCLVEILEAPAAIANLTNQLDHPDFPTRSEYQAAVNFLIESLPKLEATTIELKQAIIAFECQQKATTVAAFDEKQHRDLENAPKSVPPVPRPSEEEFRIFYLRASTGASQEVVAQMYQAHAGRPCTQGQVSRAITKIENWLDAGNLMPLIGPPDMKRAASVDPKVIDMGANQEKRTKRQRGEVDDNSRE